MAQDAPSTIIFREIFKYSWLRKLPGTEKKTAPLMKFSKVWTVFCIHDDTTPYLEIYSDKKTAGAHKPDVAYDLTNVLHITPSICTREDEFEFAITFPTEVVRFTHPSQEEMMAWVMIINSKLKEMNLLSPGENMYTSHLPESRPPLLPTRDPNSPLPLPPVAPYRLPGVELAQEMNDNSPIVSNGQSNPVAANESNSNRRWNDENTESQTQQNSRVRNSCRSNNNDAEANVTVIEVSSRSDNNSILFDFESVVDSLPDSTVVTAPSITEQNATNISVTPLNSISSSSNVTTPSSSSAEVASPTISESVSAASDLYERVFLPTNDRPSISVACVSPMRSMHMPSAVAQSQLPKMGRGKSNNNRCGSRRRSNSSSENTHAVAADRIRGAGPANTQRLQPPPHPFARQSNSSESAATRLTLREQQVAQLRREMAHPAGVRLQLRRKDCLNSIAFVDAFQAVWIAGWKQKEHPMLYNALHIGDQLVSLGGKMVPTASDAQKLIRAWPSLYLELVIRRIPRGKVFALRREFEGQPLGLVQEGNTAEIREITANSVAALHGISSHTLAMDGLSMTNWTLTEINGRPLNLFFKEGEVRDRLNAVGLDISLLVQNGELIKQLKKQLKMTKNYKEYLLQ